MADWSNLYSLEKSSSTKYFFNTSSTEIFHIEGVEGIVDGDIREGLVGHWKLDEATSSVAYDFSGNGNDGSTSGAVATSTDYCLIGRCYNFDGTDDYVEVNHNDDLVISDGTITMSLWIKVDESPGGIMGLIEKTKGSPRNNYYLNIRDDGRILGGVWDDDVQYYQYFNTNINDLLGEWVNVVFVADGQYAKAYLNGSLDAQTDWGVISIGSDDENLRIGDRKGGSFFNGLIDDVRIYNRALSADEIQHLYNSTFFDRYFYVDNACRTNDADYSLAGAAPCDAGEVEDPSTQLFTGVVEWAGKEGESSFSLSEYITRWRNDIFHQTDWSGGSGDDGPVSNSSDSYSSSTGVNSSNLGEIRIEGL
jgi:hypothetical protein